VKVWENYTGRLITKSVSTALRQKRQCWLSVARRGRISRATGRKLQVSFSDKQAELISKLKGEFGNTETEVVRGIVIAWLAEKSFISTIVKNRINQESENNKGFEHGNKKNHK